MSQDPFSMNGGAIIAMAGDRCVAIAADRRLGENFKTVNTTFQKVFRIQDNILLGLAGLATDVQTFSSLMEYKVNMYKLREDREMKPRTFASLVSSTLYEHRFGPYYVTPIVIGLEEGKPYVSTFDSIGCKSDSEAFATAGTASDNLFGIAESYYDPTLTPQQLEDVIANAFVSGVDRDILSGWEGVVYVMTEESIDVKVLKMRLD